MTTFVPKDPNYRDKVAVSFARQKVMGLFGITLARVEPGEVELTFPFREDLTQQHGFIHAGVVATACDSACGYAAFSLMPAEAAVLTVEYKINLLAPAQGDYFRAIGRRERRRDEARRDDECDGDGGMDTNGEEASVGIEGAIRAYQDVRPTYERFTEKLAHLIEELLAAAAI